MVAGVVFSTNSRRRSRLRRFFGRGAMTSPALQRCSRRTARGYRRRAPSVRPVRVVRATRRAPRARSQHRTTARAPDGPPPGPASRCVAVGWLSCRSACSSSAGSARARARYRPGRATSARPSRSRDAQTGRRGALVSGAASLRDAVVHRALAAGSTAYAPVATMDYDTNDHGRLPRPARCATLTRSSPSLSGARCSCIAVPTHAARPYCATTTTVLSDVVDFDDVEAKVDKSADARRSGRPRRGEDAADRTTQDGDEDADVAADGGEHDDPAGVILGYTSAALGRAFERRAHPVSGRWRRSERRPPPRRQIAITTVLDGTSGAVRPRRPFSLHTRRETHMLHDEPRVRAAADVATIVAPAVDHMFVRGELRGAVTCDEVDSGSSRIPESSGMGVSVTSEPIR